MIDLQNAAARGQMAFNNDLGREHEKLVSGRKAKSKHQSKGLGAFHQLPPELQRTAIITVIENTKEHKRVF